MSTAIFFVHNKTGLVEFAQGLASLGWTLLASGGTSNLLCQNNISVTEVADYTVSPEILADGSKPSIPPSTAGYSPTLLKQILLNFKTSVGILLIW